MAIDIVILMGGTYMIYLQLFNYLQVFNYFSQVEMKKQFLNAII